MEVKHFLEPDLTRYQFDMDYCHFSGGWAQVDTNSDASWYGNWANPFERKLVQYAEGDVTITECDNDEEFIEAVRGFVNWHKGNETWKGIDTMCCDKIEERFVEMGLEDCFHECDRELRETAAAAAAA